MLFLNTSLAAAASGGRNFCLTARPFVTRFLVNFVLCCFLWDAECCLLGFGLQVKHRCCPSSFIRQELCGNILQSLCLYAVFSVGSAHFFDVKSLFVFRAVERLFYLFFAPEGVLFCEKRGKNADFAKKKWKMFCS